MGPHLSPQHRVVPETLTRQSADCRDRPPQGVAAPAGPRTHPRVSLGRGLGTQGIAGAGGPAPGASLLVGMQGQSHEGVSEQASHHRCPVHVHHQELSSWEGSEGVPGEARFPAFYTAVAAGGPRTSVVCEV